MSDLQCPARVIFVPHPEREAPRGGAIPGDARLAGVFVATALGADPSVLEPARRLADEVSCPLEVLADVATGADLEGAVEHLADLHRGESIAVIAPADVLRDALGLHELPTAPITVAIDASGWVVVRSG